MSEGYALGPRYTYPLGSLVTVTPSTEEPLTRDEAKLWAKLESDEVEEDALVDGLIARARARYEAFTGRTALQQTYDWYQDRQTYGYAQVLCPPRWPLVSIGSIRTFSTTDASDIGGTTMPAANYYVDIASEPGRVVPVSAATWPPATRIINALIMRFTAGYSTSSTGVPEGIKTQLKMMVAAAYEHRGDEQEMEAAMDAVLRNDELDLPDWG